MKKTLLAIALVILLLSIAAYAQASAATATPTPAAESGEAAGEVVMPEFEGPYIVTTCGQSPGAVMVSMSAMQAKITAKSDNALTADTLDTETYKTLVITTGTSMKGMGAAGTDVDAEIVRCLAVIAKAKEAGMVVIGAHIEGMARRVDSMDEASIAAVMAEADVILAIAESDSDGFFTKYAQENGKPIIVVKDALAVGAALN